ncbi:hypothetical protein PsYK624_064270 [Phanerochaete sordida]|uniref:F-box domain-containing protein n=1 Tax=Phanerochaete sordida TaxID=48140 RepID=A0A9P3LDF8_9APHY|nr:hypothetical protein PsYK624_064270 [Phanerochaete sordida]
MNGSAAAPHPYSTTRLKPRAHTRRISTSTLARHLSLFSTTSNLFQHNDMSAHFLLVNVDARESVGGADAKFGEIFWEPKNDLALSLVKYWGPERRTLNIWKDKEVTAREAKISAKSALLRLPNEILAAMFDEIDDLESCACLCISHDILGVVGEARLRELALPKAGPWAGHRLICCSPNCDTYPSSVHDEIVAQAAAYDALPGPEESDSDSDFYSGFPGCVHATYERRESPRSWYSEQWNAELFDRMVCPTPGFTRRDRKMLFTIYSVVNGVLGSIKLSASDLVLCNLSKGEYVRNNAVAEFNSWATDELQADARERAASNSHYSRTSLRYFSITFGIVLFSRICWADYVQECSMNEHVADRIAKGPWAGDRFEIVPAAKMDPTVEWKDVSEEVMALMRDMFEYEYR